MNAADTRPDWMVALFGEAVISQEEVEAGLAEMRAADAARLQAQREAATKREAERAANRCPKCAGSGYLSQFAHRKGGECFTCGGSGIFTRYAA